MPDRWLFLTGAPTLQQLHDASARDDDNLAVESATSRWLEVKQSSEVSLHKDANLLASSGIPAEAASWIDDEDEDDAAGIQAVLLEKSRLVAEESYSRRLDKRQDQSLAVPPPPAQQQQEDSGDMEYSESLLPPPTQPHRRGAVDENNNNSTINNQTTIEESLVNLPNWSFSLSSITRLDSLSSVSSGLRVNLLALISDLDPPSVIPLKKPSRTGKFQALRASLSLLEMSGATLDIVLWDEYAEKWAGESLMIGDVVYLEKIALSEYRGKRQGSTVEGSKVQICYRTLDTGRQEENKTLRPDLGLGWDQASVRVKALVQLAASLG